MGQRAQQAALHGCAAGRYKRGWWLPALPIPHNASFYCPCPAGLVTEVWPLLNEAAYGSRQAATPHGILNGDVEPPACMPQLYAALGQ